MVLFLALPAAPASAANVTATTSFALYHKGQGYTELRVRVDGGPEDDVLEAAGAAQGNAVTVRGTGLTAGPGCIEVDTATVRCAADGADSATSSVTLSGGGGDDALRVTGAGLATLDGGPGADSLSGPGTLIGGPGPDRFRGGGTISYAERSDPIAVDLAAGTGPDGDTIAPGTWAVVAGAGADTLVAGPRPVALAGGDGADTLRGGSAMNGGPGNDTLFARDAGSLLTGGDGDDVLTGGPSADQLDGGPGADTLTGGAGVDRLEGGDGGDRVDAGPDRDAIFAGAGDTVEARDGTFDGIGCAAPALGAVLFVDRGDMVLGCGRRSVKRDGAPRPKVTNVTTEAGRVVLDVGCPDDMPGRCRVRVRVRDDEGAVGRTTRVLRPGTARTVAVPVPGSCRRLTVRIDFRDGAGRPIGLHRAVNFARCGLGSPAGWLPPPPSTR